MPPFGDFFNPGTGFAWASWKTSGGKEGIEPPSDVKALYKQAEKFIQYPMGTEMSNQIGQEIMDIHVRNLWKIGTVGNIVNPIVHRNDLANFKKFQAKTYDYYWTYPYRSFQWYLKK